MHSKKTAFIVEHDFIMAAYLADRWCTAQGGRSLWVVLHGAAGTSWPPATLGSFSGGAEPPRRPVIKCMPFQSIHPLHTFYIFAPSLLCACRVIVYEGLPSREATAKSPQSLLTGGRVGWCTVGGPCVVCARASPPCFRPQAGSALAGVAGNEPLPPSL